MRKISLAKAALILLLALLLAPTARAAVTNPGGGSSGGGSSPAAVTNIVLGLASSSTNALGRPITNLLWGRTLWVDSVHGSMFTCLRGDAAKPFGPSGPGVLNACNTNAVRGDTVQLRAGVYNLVAGSTINLPHGVSLKGAGRNCTFITLTNADVNNPLIAPGSDSTIEDITFIAWTPGGGSDLLKVVAPLAFSTAKYWTNAVFKNCDLYGQTDVYYVSGNEPCVARFEGCLLRSQWDVVVTGGGAPHLNQFFNCDLVADGYGHDHDRVDVFGDVNILKTSSGSTNLFYNCRIVATNDLFPDLLPPPIGLYGAHIVLDFGSFSQTSHTYFANCSISCAGTNDSSRFGGYEPWEQWKNSNHVVRVENCSPQYVYPGETNYNADINDSTIMMTNGPARVIVLPNIGPHGRAEYDGMELSIADLNGTASGTNIYVITRGNQKINNGPTITNIVNGDYGTGTLKVKGTNWIIKHSYP